MKSLHGEIRKERSDWRSEAECRYYDPDTFFEDKTVARGICKVCPVQEDCFWDSVMDPSRVGIAAGLTENQRSKLRKKMRDAA